MKRTILDEIDTIDYARALLPYVCGRVTVASLTVEVAEAMARGLALHSPHHTMVLQVAWTQWCDALIAYSTRAPGTSPNAPKE